MEVEIEVKGERKRKYLQQQRQLFTQATLQFCRRPSSPGTADQSLVENLDVRYKATIMVPLIPNQCCEKLSLFLAGGPNLSV